MKERGLKRLRMAACALASLLFAGTAAAQNPLAAKTSEKKSPPAEPGAEHLQRGGVQEGARF